MSRYHRQIQLPEIGPAGQQRLQAARILCVGAGGLGSAVLPYLVAAGVGVVGIVDHDTVELSNLQRQTLYAESDIGQPKADMAAKRLSSLNTDINIIPYAKRLTSENAAVLIAAYDVIVDCTDNHDTKYLINDTCFIQHKPDIFASVCGFDGHCTIFNATVDTSSGPCYRCLYPAPPPPDLLLTSAEIGILGVVPGMLGMVQAAEAIKWITGVGNPLMGRLLRINLSDMTFHTLTLRKNPACPLCSVQHTCHTGGDDFHE